MIIHDTLPPFDPHRTAALAPAEACNALLAYLNALTPISGANLTAADLTSLASVADTLLALFTRPDFRIPDELTVPFIRHNRTIANLLFLTRPGAADAALETLRNQPHNFAKILTLLSPRTAAQFPIAAFFDLSPPLASLWFSSYAASLNAANCDPAANARLRAHFRFRHPNLQPLTDIPNLYYGVSYLGDDSDRLFKPFMNDLLRRTAAPLRVTNTPDPRSIAVLSAAWNPTHSVYRTLSEHVRSLRPHYRLTFIFLGPRALLPHQETSLFDAVHAIDAGNGRIDLAPVLTNDFALAYFPDVGMSQESALLANLRFAPIQLAGLGHSVSSFGALIDYFVTGADVERPDLLTQNYSEKSLLLPGAGLIHTPPPVNLPPRPPRDPADDRVIINAAWSAQKITADFLNTLQQLFRDMDRRVTLRLMLSGSASHALDLAAIAKTFAAALPSISLDIRGIMPYPAYMHLLQQGDLALDTYPFGGCNTISDSLFLHIPPLCRESTHWPGRIAPHMLRQIGLNQLAVSSESDYITTAHRLITDTKWRTHLHTHLTTTNLTETLYNTSPATHFLTTIQSLIQ